MALILPTHYSFDSRRTANWTQAQEKTISSEYPFSLVDEPLDQYVARIYLQFLWLPESIMPLNLLIPSMSRISVPSSSSDASVHPMHAFLEPLLLTTRSVTQKYHQELPQILADSGGAGEMEETMMWYALTHEKGDPNVPTSLDNSDGPWADEKWQQNYMDRMERREMQIQILLHLFKLSLPGPPPQQKKKKKRSKKDQEPVLSLQEHLEAFMDKLSMRQLVSTLDRTVQSSMANEENAKDERDWIQIFAEDIVDKSFITKLPELCKLLHTKVFPSSPFSDDESDDVLSQSYPLTQPNVSPSPSPPQSTVINQQQQKRAISRAPSLFRARSISRAPSISLIPSPTHSTISNSRANTSLARSRSRSLSISLAQEKQERERATHAPPKKRVVNREVSMSRVFKPKPKSISQAEVVKTVKEPAAPSKATSKPKVDLGVTLVEETPVKPRVAPGARSNSTRQPSFGQPMFSFGAGRTESRTLHTMKEEDVEEEWVMESSPPDVISFSPSNVKRRLLSDEEDEDHDDGMSATATPSKPPKMMKR